MLFPPEHERSYQHAVSFFHLATPLHLTKAYQYLQNPLKPFERPHLDFELFVFLPAEAVFAEIHAYHPELIQEAMAKKVWLVSPTTLMAVLNTARAVLKDVETRKQVHIIKSELGKLGKEFDRFDTRMKKLADNIRQAHENAQDVHITSQKITQRFTQIEKVELEEDSNNVLDFEEKPMIGKENES